MPECIRCNREADRPNSRCGTCEGESEKRRIADAKKATRCRHLHFWVFRFNDGGLLWCYECGAIRRIEGHAATNGFVPSGKWVKPVGPGGENPAMTIVFESIEKGGA